MEEIQAILDAVVGGARYGFKIRVPHALVMTALFRRDLSSTEKIRSILKLAMEHAGNLAMFAAIYKVNYVSFPVMEEFFVSTSNLGRSRFQGSSFLIVDSSPIQEGISLFAKS